MATEFDRRDRLMDKCLDLANLSMKQKDLDTAGLMLRKSLDLLAVQMQAMELMNPGYFESLKDDPDWVQLFETLRKAADK